MQFDRGLKTPRRFDLEQFRTLCLEAAALTNDRPLGVQPWDREEGRDSLTHVSPNKLISGRASQIVPVNLTVREAIHQGMNISIIYKHRTKVLRLYWNEFRANYLRSLKFTPKWFQKFPGDIEPGTMVLYRDSVHMKPGQFQIGNVIGTNRRPDGSIKTLVLKTPTNKNPIERNIRNCYLSEHEFLKLTQNIHSCLLQDLEDKDDG